jgi:hypothetical protein
MIYKVFIKGPGSLAYARMFMNEGNFVGTDDPDKADIICYTGGADVHPSTYGEQVDPVINCYYDIARDRSDVEMFKFAKAKGVYQVGICRGGQFLNVMSGGKLWYDIDNHTQAHHASIVHTQDGVLVEKGKVLVSSTHHQQFIAGPGAEILMIADECTMKLNASDQWVLGNDTTEDEYDLESVWYPKTGCLCFQPHPEFGEYVDCRKTFFQFLEKTYKSFTTNKYSEAG